eukprot:3094916-Amphidinium_carterae.1
MRALHRFRRLRRKLRTQWEEKQFTDILEHSGKAFKGYKEFALRKVCSKSLRKIGRPTTTFCTVQDFEGFWQQVYGISMGEKMVREQVLKNFLDNTTVDAEELPEMSGKALEQMAKTMKKTSGGNDGLP